MVPATLGDFAIQGLLGEGGSSLVYSATRADRPGEELALKVLHPDLALSEREIERFLDEARKLDQVGDPGIVSLRAAGRLPDGRPFIAMPRLRGRSLGDRLRAEPLAPTRALELFAGLGRAVIALHDAGLIHRDIKPDNVFWLEPEDRLVLLDLGIARDTESSPSTTTRAGLSRGTPDYMAPERLFGQRASVRTDVYELALLLYVMLARRPPWEEGDAQGRLDPKVDPVVAATLPPATVSALEDSLALDPNRRPGSVGELLERIGARGANGQPIVADAARLDAVTRAERMPPPRLVLTPNSTASVDPALGTAATELHRPASVPYGETTSSGLAQPTQRSAGQQGASTEVAAMPASSRARTIAPISVGLFIAAAGIAAAVFITTRRTTANVSTVDRASPAEPAPRHDPSADATARAGGDPHAPAIPASAASASAATASSSSATPVRPQPSSSAAIPPSSSAAPVPSTSAAPPSGKPMPPSCAKFLALMCSPTSGATPRECSTWTTNVNGWVAKYPPDVADSNCSAAFSTTAATLPERKGWKPPP